MVTAKIKAGKLEILYRNKDRHFLTDSMLFLEIFLVMINETTNQEEA